MKIKKAFSEIRYFGIAKFDKLKYNNREGICKLGRGKSNNAKKKRIIS